MEFGIDYKLCGYCLKIVNYSHYYFYRNKTMKYENICHNCKFPIHHECCSQFKYIDNIYWITCKYCIIKMNNKLEYSH